MNRYLYLILIVAFAACKGNNNPDVSHIKVDLQVDRFEQAFFRIDSGNINHVLRQLRNTNPAFYPLYLRDVLYVDPMDSGTFDVIRGLLTTYRPVNEHLQKKYKDMDWLKEDLTRAYKYVKYYFPEYKTPSRVVTYVSTFDDKRDILLWPEYLGIGLQLFAGKDFAVYKEEPIQALYPTYISRRFDKEYIVPQAMKMVADDVYPDRSAGMPMIEQMVEKGKQWWLVDHFLPDAPDSVKTGYTGRQLNWLEENEGNAWSYLMKNENLYSIDPETIQTYIGEAPFTQGMSEASPGNIGQWFGKRIVEKYAKAHSSVKLPEILATPAKTIFQESGYKPK